MFPKFRAWHKELQLMGKIISICFDGPENKITRVKMMTSQGLITVLPNDLKNIEIMQWTGLQDRDVRHIYEADILELGTPDLKSNNIQRLIVYVAWNTTGAGYVLYNDKHDEVGSVFNIANTFQEPIFKIIGNIYENPELLK